MGGVGYINDIGDSNSLGDRVEANLGNNDVLDHVPGAATTRQLSPTAMTMARLQVRKQSVRFKVNLAI